MYPFLCLSPENEVWKTIAFYYSDLSYSNEVDEDDLYWDGKKREEESASSHNSAHVISQLAQCFRTSYGGDTNVTILKAADLSDCTNAMVGPRAWIGGFFSRASNRKFGSDNYTLTPIQEALRDLWDAAFPNVKLKGLISEQWKDMGWQGANPSTDFRCSFISCFRPL
ncbi:ELMO domain-containing protein A [Sesamum angolense]|uniref:ELMO domain-containing protein A n=1 Tax=Sesamum angolense TaxID=2727404 RepID=A0AAE1W3F6_9LAMI|nr:ELMO domain-containing protein A [Sesamum angolense]